jgi:hypothetical protein
MELTWNLSKAIGGSVRLKRGKDGGLDDWYILILDTRLFFQLRGARRVSVSKVAERSEATLLT